MPRTDPDEPAYTIDRGDGPLVAAALHDGHAVRPEVAARLALSDAERRREEDPFTGAWTEVGDHRIVVHRSRFEVDPNRPRDGAVYLEPEQAWGLEVWRQPPSEQAVARSLAIYDRFHEEVGALFRELAERHGRFVVFDLHSYNHRRGGPEAEPDDPLENPEVNLGTGSLDRDRWAPVVERFLAELRCFDFSGRRLDVRENVRFLGGHFARWAHETFPEAACVLAVEWKKLFMDEWTGEPFPRVTAEIRRALSAAADGVRDELGRGPVDGVAEAGGRAIAAVGP